MPTLTKKQDFDDKDGDVRRGSSLVNKKAVMNQNNDNNYQLDTPYGKMKDEDEFDPYNDELSETHNISMIEAYEHKWDFRKTIISTSMLLTMATIIFLAIWYKDYLMEQIIIFMDVIKENPVATVLIYWGLMTFMISASVPSAIPQVMGSYIFVHAFGFMNGFLLMVAVDYVSMLVGWVPPFLFARYLLRSWVSDYASDKPKLLALSTAMSKNAKKLVSLMRCCALTPYVVFNIVWGITEMKLVDYWIGNLAIILCDGPYIYICCSISKITHGVQDTSASGILEFIVIIISVLIVLGVAIYVYKIAQAEADKIIEQRRSTVTAYKTRSRIENLASEE
jgi:uncharacterized membrane protein YdjX (TVP38/TMEM64 family)